MKCQYLDSLPADAQPIPGFPKCFATPAGHIITQHGRTKLRRFGRNSCGYLICGLKGSDRKHCFPLVHRIIARLFVLGDQTLTVNHKDMDKANCAASNLEWVTHSENHLKGQAMKPDWRKKAGTSVNRAVVATHPQTGERHEFKSGKAAALWIGNVSASGNISKATKNGRTAYGFEWCKG